MEDAVRDAGFGVLTRLSTPVVLADARGVVRWRNPAADEVLADRCRPGSALGPCTDRGLVPGPCHVLVGGSRREAVMAVGPDGWVLQLWLERPPVPSVDPGDHLQAELERARRYHRPLALAYLEVAALEGDVEPEDLHRVLVETVRDGDVLWRIGETAWVTILPETTPDGARGFANRAREVLAERAGVLARVGLANAHPHDGCEDLVRRARKGCAVQVVVP